MLGTQVKQSEKLEMPSGPTQAAGNYAQYTRWDARGWRRQGQGKEGKGWVGVTQARVVRCAALFAVRLHASQRPICVLCLRVCFCGSLGGRTFPLLQLLLVHDALRAIHVLRLRGSRLHTRTERIYAFRRVVFLLEAGTTFNQVEEFHRAEREVRGVEGWGGSGGGEGLGLASCFSGSPITGSLKHGSREAFDSSHVLHCLGVYRLTEVWLAYFRRPFLSSSPSPPADMRAPPLIPARPSGTTLSEECGPGVSGDAVCGNAGRLPRIMILAAGLGQNYENKMLSHFSQPARRTCPLWGASRAPPSLLLFSTPRSSTWELDRRTTKA